MMMIMISIKLIWVIIIILMMNIIILIDIMIIIAIWTIMIIDTIIIIMIIIVENFSISIRTNQVLIWKCRTLIFILQIDFKSRCHACYLLSSINIYPQPWFLSLFLCHFRSLSLCLSCPQFFVWSRFHKY